MASSSEFGGDLISASTLGSLLDQLSVLSEDLTTIGETLFNQEPPHFLFMRHEGDRPVPEHLAELLQPLIDTVAELTSEARVLSELLNS